MSKHLAFSTIAFILSLSLHAQNFTVIDSLRQGAYGTAAWGDYDGDGRKDLAYVSQTMTVDSPDMFHIYHNTLLGFELVATMPMLFGPSVVWADFDNDGKDDIVASGLGSPDGALHIYKSNGDGNFPLVNDTLEGFSFGAIDVADYDNDGLLDFAATGIPNIGPLKTIVYRNEGNFQFVNIGAALKGIDMGEIKWHDYDHDGKQDLLLSGRTDLAVATYLYHNEGNDSFSLHPAYMKGASGTVDWFDYNDDGHSDILIAGTDSTFGNNFLDLHLNNGNGTFTKQASNLPVFGEPVATDIADFNGDGKPDICFVGGSENFPLTFSAMCIGNGTTNFSATAMLPADITNVIVAAADIDNDGDQDMIFCNYILRNDGSTSNIKDLTKTATKFYPNPADDIIVIDTEVEQTQVSLIDILGRQVWVKTLPKGKSKIDIKAAPASNYLLKFVQGKNYSIKMISIQ